ncbi:MAG: exonuclease subunit SbcD [Clostridiales bacterium]|jgi:DNA repair exonuclease SbcCD nuclease subunit|nr:exonuclease subunit SbcD [Clostridiales bacterium]
MKILHTSDWNLGKKFFDRDRAFEQKAVLAEIVNIANDRKPDIVLIAGNIFDGFNPPAKSLELFGDAVGKLAAGGRRAVVVIGGKNDSPAKLKAFKHLADKQGVSIVADVSDVALKTNPSFFTRVTASGKGYIEVTCENGETAMISVVPNIAAYDYISLKGDDFNAKVDGILKAAPQNTTAFKIALVGAKPDELTCQYENGKLLREIFKGYGYTALGGGRAVLDDENATFAPGSIMDYDFDEKEKCVLVAETSGGKLKEVEAVALSAAKKTRNVIVSDFLSADAELKGYEDAYVRLFVSSDKPVQRSIVDNLQKKYPLLTEIVFSGAIEDAKTPKLANPKDEDVFLEYLEKAGITDFTGYVKLFKAITEEQNETTEA